MDNSDEEDEDKHNHGTDGPGEIFKESDEKRGANDRTRQSNDEGYNCEEIIKNQQEKIVVFIVTVMLIKISDKSFESCSSWHKEENSREEERLPCDSSASQD